MDARGRERARSTTEDVHTSTCACSTDVGVQIECSLEEGMPCEIQSCDRVCGLGEGAWSAVAAARKEFAAPGSMSLSFTWIDGTPDPYSPHTLRFVTPEFDFPGDPGDGGGGGSTVFSKPPARHAASGANEAVFSLLPGFVVQMQQGKGSQQIRAAATHAARHRRRRN